MRCEEHGLAAGPGGECVLCLRAVRDRAERKARRIGAAFFGFVGLACAALIATRVLRPMLAPAQPLSVHAERAPLSLPAAAETSAAPTAPLAEPPSVFSPAPAPLPTSALANAPSASENSRFTRVSGVVSAEPVALAERAGSARVPSQRELQATLQATPVTMFSASWCPHCLRARRFFQAQGLRVTDHDIDLDAQAAAELKRRSGGKAVPLIDVDGRVLRGFDERATMDAVVASVERRLGVTGVKLSAMRASN